MKKEKIIKEKNEKRKNIISYIPIIIAITILIIDQIIKSIISTWEVGKSIIVIPKILWITYVQNTGVSFGMFQGNNLIFIFISITILGLLIYWSDKFNTRIEKYAYWLIISGLLGNLFDRLFRGFVIDMLNLGWWPVFNIADSTISIAIILLIIEEIINNKKEKKKKNKKKKEEIKKT